MDAERRCVYALPQHIPHGLHHQRLKITEKSISFASAHPTRIASLTAKSVRTVSDLCLSTSHTDCIQRQRGSRRRYELCLSTSHTDCIFIVLSNLLVLELCLSTSHTDCIPVVRRSFRALIFASAHPTRIASRHPRCQTDGDAFASAHSTRIASC